MGGKSWPIANYFAKIQLENLIADILLLKKQRLIDMEYCLFWLWEVLKVGDDRNEKFGELFEWIFKKDQQMPDLSTDLIESAEKELETLLCSLHSKINPVSDSTCVSDPSPRLFQKICDLIHHTNSFWIEKLLSCQDKIRLVCQKLECWVPFDTEAISAALLREDYSLKKLEVLLFTVKSLHKKICYADDLLGSEVKGFERVPALPGDLFSKILHDVPSIQRGTSSMVSKVWHDSWKAVNKLMIDATPPYDLSGEYCKVVDGLLESWPVDQSVNKIDIHFSKWFTPIKISRHFEGHRWRDKMVIVKLLSDFGSPLPHVYISSPFLTMLEVDNLSIEAPLPYPLPNLRAASLTKICFTGGKILEISESKYESLECLTLDAKSSSSIEKLTVESNRLVELSLSGFWKLCAVIRCNSLQSISLMLSDYKQESEFLLGDSITKGTFRLSFCQSLKQLLTKLVSLTLLSSAVQIVSSPNLQLEVLQSVTLRTLEFPEVCIVPLLRASPGLRSLTICFTTLSKRQEKKCKNLADPVPDMEPRPLGPLTGRAGGLFIEALCHSLHPISSHAITHICVETPVTHDFIVGLLPVFLICMFFSVFFPFDH